MKIRQLTPPTIREGRVVSCSLTSKFKFDLIEGRFVLQEISIEASFPNYFGDMDAGSACTCTTCLKDSCT